jgi:hypothetical protein
MIREDARQVSIRDARPVDPWAWCRRPDMEGAAIRAIEYQLARLDREHDNYSILEWGHGGSTYFFGDFLKDSKKRFAWTALDWHAGRVDHINQHLGLEARVGLIYEEDYVGFPRQLEQRFDLVLMTGLHQRECLEQLQHVTAEGSWVLIYDPEHALHREASALCSGNYFFGSSIWRGRRDR